MYPNETKDACYSAMHLFNEANWEISQIWLVISHRPSPPFYGLKPEGIGSIHDTEAFGVYPASVGS